MAEPSFRMASDSGLEITSISLLGKRARAKKRTWRVEEDKVLMAAVEQHGAANWDFLASHLQGRSGKQCRERYHNILDPEVKKAKWSEEVYILYELPLMHASLFFFRKKSSFWTCMQPMATAGLR